MECREAGTHRELPLPGRVGIVTLRRVFSGLWCVLLRVNRAVWCCSQTDLKGKTDPSFTPRPAWGLVLLSLLELSPVLGDPEGFR